MWKKGAGRHFAVCMRQSARHWLEWSTLANCGKKRKRASGDGRFGPSFPAAAGAFDLLPQVLAFFLIFWGTGAARGAADIGYRRAGGRPVGRDRPGPGFRGAGSGVSRRALCRFPAIGGNRRGTGTQVGRGGERPLMGGDGTCLLEIRGRRKKIPGPGACWTARTRGRSAQAEYLSL